MTLITAATMCVACIWVGKEEENVWREEEWMLDLQFSPNYPLSSSLWYIMKIVLFDKMIHTLSSYRLFTFMIITLIFTVRFYSFDYLILFLFWLYFVSKHYRINITISRYINYFSKETRSSNWRIEFCNYNFNFNRNILVPIVRCSDLSKFSLRTC